MEAMEKYLEKCNFEKYYEKLIKKFAGKKIAIYGTGILFQLVNKKYDLSKLNIIAITDKKYSDGQKETDFGYKVIKKEELETLDYDVLFIGVQRYNTILNEFASKTLKHKKIKILPLVKKPLLMSLKELWVDFKNYNMV